MFAAHDKVAVVARVTGEQRKIHTFVTARLDTDNRTLVQNVLKLVASGRIPVLVAYCHRMTAIVIGILYLKKR